MTNATAPAADAALRRSKSSSKKAASVRLALVTDTATPKSPYRSPLSKRVNNVRISWFVIGALFGIGLSFAMNILISNIVIPEYHQLVEEQKQSENASKTSASIGFGDWFFGQREDAKPKAKTPAPLALPDVPELPTYPRSLSLKVGSGDTLIDMLTRAHVDYDEAVDAIDALRKTYNPRSLRIGQKIELSLDQHPTLPEKATITNLSIPLNVVASVELERLPSGSFFVEKTSKPLSPELTYAGGSITNSLFETGNDAGIPEGVLAEMVKAYSYDVDFQRDIHRGDQMEVLYEKMVTDEGDEAGFGNILYAMLKTKGKPIKIYQYKGADGVTRFYDVNGESIVKALLKTPVNGARISSGFGMRRHPILGFSKMHQGIDFAAPTGTPIYAAGDGVVSYKGWRGGYGNYIQVKHNGEYATAYAHISRFPRGMHSGKRVKQGEVIAYVGTTGRSTGPHLHYEILRYGRQVNPQNQKFKTGDALKGPQLAQFKSHVNKIENQIASMPKASTKVASN